MKPLSVVKRRMYLSLSATLFFICIPVLILYATGYRFNTAMNLIKTGGVFIAIPYSGTNVYVGDELVKQNGVFQKNAFVQNLKPGSYTIKAEKEGYQSWTKNLTVFPQTVTEGYPFLLPEKSTLTEVFQFPLEKDTVATNTKTLKVVKKETAEYVSVANLFKPITLTATSTATSTGQLKLRRKLSVENRKGSLTILWTGEKDATPHYFCENEVCKKTITIENKNPILSFDFFPGRDDLIIFSTKDGIYVSEIDDRSKQNVDTVLFGQNLDVRVYNNDTIYIKNGKQYFAVTF